MKIVDLRPPMVRRFSRSNKSPSKPHGLGRLAGFVSDNIISRRVSRRPIPAASPLLVSVGNLAMGGTGKTPVVMALAEDLAAAGLHGAVLTRGYGSSLAGPLVVQTDNHLAGDEARMMAQRLNPSGWPVVQSRNRPQGLDFLNKLSPDLQIILLEDAFQTGSLARHIDLVILDSWLITDEGMQPYLKPMTGSVFPFGPWRETATGADRASVLLVEGGPHLPEFSHQSQPVFSFRRTVELCHVSGSPVGAEALNCALVSGIARPDKFEASAVQLLENPAVLALRFRDHVKYDQSLVKTILKAMDEAGAENLLTTAKDWVKLSDIWNDSRPVMVQDMQLEWEKKDALNHWLVQRVL